MGFVVIKNYDACCDRCNNWYSTYFKLYNNATKKEAIKEMRMAGWCSIKGETLCHVCSVEDEE